MNLDHIRNEIARMRVQIRRQQNEIEMLRRAGIGTASENCYLQGCEPRWMIFAIEERSYELSLKEWQAISY